MELPRVMLLKVGGNRLARKTVFCEGAKEEARHNSYVEVKAH